MRVNFNQGCFLDYTARKFFRRDQIVEEDHEYVFRYNNIDLHQVLVWMSYIGNNWDK
jgi:hypothetical protein